MSKLCHKKGPGNSIYELDIYSDMNMALSEDCPKGWQDGGSPIDCAEEDTKHNCYKCNGNMRQVTTSCIPPDSNAIPQCGNGYEDYPIKCNYPSMDDLKTANPKVYDVRYCPCQQTDGTITGYSPMCCPQTGGNTPMPYVNTNAPKVISAGVTKLPWFAWLLAVGGLIYIINIQNKNSKKKNK